jgi:adenylyltransferase/sulfurtransferase
VPEITAQELKAKVDARQPFFLLDVRETHEWQISRIEGATLIPLGQVANRAGELPRDVEIIVHCKMGGRSAKAVAILKEKGIEASNLKGGILEWIEKVDPTLAKY